MKPDLGASSSMSDSSMSWVLPYLLMPSSPGLIGAVAGRVGQHREGHEPVQRHSVRFSTAQGRRCFVAHVGCSFATSRWSRMHGDDECLMGAQDVVCGLPRAVLSGSAQLQQYSCAVASVVDTCMVPSCCVSRVSRPESCKDGHPVVAIVQRPHIVTILARGPLALATATLT